MTFNSNNPNVKVDVEGGVEAPPDLLSPTYRLHGKSADTTDTASPSASEGEEMMFHLDSSHRRVDDNVPDVCDIPSSQASRCAPRKKLLLWFALALVAIGAVIGAVVGVTIGARPDEEVRNSAYERAQEGKSQQLHPTASPPTTHYTPPAEDGFGGMVVENDPTPTSSSPTNGGNTEEGSSSTMAPTSEVFDIILSHSQFHGLEFQDPNSYQSKAVKWVEETAVFGTHSIERLVQRYALACLYYATNAVQTIYTDDQFGNGVIPPWVDETGWLLDDNECNWYRLECNDAGFVTSIKLYQNRLTGSLPPELVSLRDTLVEIDLFQNPIYNSGDEGLAWLGELSNLQHLYYGRTYFEYNGIPAAIGQLTNLVEYDCSYTLHNGPLRGEVFQHLTNLEYLNMGGNSYFNSSVPLELAELPNLQYVYIDYADIKGDLEFIPVMPNIRELWIDRNPLITGTIPTEIALAESLQSLSLSRLGLTGTIPTELASLRLKQLWVFSNQLTGTIPTEFSTVVSLKTLALEDNQLVGAVPEGMCMNTIDQGGMLERLDADCSEGDALTCDCCTCCGALCTGDKL